MANVALLLGFFAAPLALLALGHRLRDRTYIQRRAFWGGVIGHTMALLVAVVALHYPAMVWSGGVRTFAVFWLMLAAAAAGALLGAVSGRGARG